MRTRKLGAAPMRHDILPGMEDLMKRLDDSLEGLLAVGNQVTTWAGLNPFWGALLGILILFFVAWLVHLVLRHFLVAGIHHVVRRSRARWDDSLQEAGVFRRLALVIPIFVIWQGVGLLPHVSEHISGLVARVAVSCFVLVGVSVVSAMLNAFGTVYAANPQHGRRSIKSYLQVAEMVAMAIGAILILAILLERSPMVFLGGLGAMTAVLMLVFKDTILGFVASLQIAGNDMVRVGDWIEMPSAGADGDVIDIALHTMKIQNFDKTITTVPTYLLIQESFKNWRGMSESGGRRIKRSLHFDINTIRFLDSGEIERFSRYALLHDYIAEKKEELERYNEESKRDAEIQADIRRLTNIGTLRAYIERYLANHPHIHRGMTVLVRQLQPNSDGVPIEIYCFTNTTDWNRYEAIQADIFDHMMAILPEFGLRIFQNESDYAQQAPQPPSTPGAP